MTHELADRCDFQPGDIVDGKYSVKKSLGEGSFGVVYLVEDLQSHQPRALKLLRLWEVPAEIRLSLKNRFKMEFETGQIACDNLVQSLHYGDVSGNPYIIMEFCPGGDLSPYLGKKDIDAIGICHDILKGLSALHQRGKVHRDLKPENVLFKQNTIAALTDFGIVGDSKHRMTHLGIFGRPDQIFGTYAYMPPEQANRARGGATVLPTTDVFSFGVLAYQLLTGQLPFGSLESQDELVDYLKRGKDGSWNSEALRNISDGDHWARLIGACLMPDFRSRLQSADEVLQLLPAANNERRRIMHFTSPNSNDVSNAYIPKKGFHGFCLRVLQGEEFGRHYDLTSLVPRDRRILTLGRSRSNLIYVKSDYSDYMSRRHCTIEADKSEKRWIVRDGQWIASEHRWQPSQNGTYVNSRPVSSKGFYLKPGDIITAGDITLRFENY